MKRLKRTQEEFLNEMIEYLDAHAMSGATPQIGFGDQFEMPIPQK